MDTNKFHKNFKLNGKLFSSTKEITSYSTLISDDFHDFLKDWFSQKKYIVVQTSGSTGTPKPIKLEKKWMVNSAITTGIFFDVLETKKALLCLPMKYIAGKMMIVRALTLGWELDVFPPDSDPLKNNQKNYDFSAMVPLQLENSLSKIDQIKKIIVGGGVVNSTLQKKLQNLKTEVFATYGMTETCTHIAIKRLNKTTKKVIFFDVFPKVKIYQDTRNCLVIDAPKVFDSVIFTNDVVRLISDTQFEWLGRYDTIINSGGIKLHPERIEQKLTKIISQRFFVTGISDAFLGEKLTLIIEGKTTKNLLEKIKTTKILSKFEIPKSIHFVENFIETENGKIHRKKTLKNYILIF